MTCVIKKQLLRDGLLPAPLSRLLPKADTPYIALITSSVLSYAITALLYCITGGDDQVGSALINMALFGKQFIELKLKKNQYGATKN